MAPTSMERVGRTGNSSDEEEIRVSCGSVEVRLSCRRMYLLSKEIKGQLPQYHPDVEEPSCSVAKPVETNLPHANPTYVQEHMYKKCYTCVSLARASSMRNEKS